VTESVQLLGIQGRVERVAHHRVSVLVGILLDLVVEGHDAHVLQRRGELRELAIDAEVQLNHRLGRDRIEGELLQDAAHEVVLKELHFADEVEAVVIQDDHVLATFVDHDRTRRDALIRRADNGLKHAGNHVFGSTEAVGELVRELEPVHGVSVHEGSVDRTLVRDAVAAVNRILLSDGGHVRLLWFWYPTLLITINYLNPKSV